MSNDDGNLTKQNRAKTEPYGVVAEQTAVASIRGKSDAHISERVLRAGNYGVCARFFFLSV
jgi:hypothetical protein